MSGLAGWAVPVRASSTMEQVKLRSGFASHILTIHNRAKSSTARNPTRAVKTPTHAISIRVQILALSAATATLISLSRSFTTTTSMSATPFNCVCSVATSAGAEYVRGRPAKNASALFSASGSLTIGVHHQSADELIAFRIEQRKQQREGMRD